MQSQYAPVPAAPLPWPQRLISRGVQALYFNRVNLLDTQGQPIPPLQDTIPTIFYASHRNGAVDGYIMQKLHAKALSMVSIQLVAHPYLKYYFSGIPVMRDKDTQRYAQLAQHIDNPVLHAISHVQAGGSLCIYPEGSSQWGHTHLPYQPGGAKIIRHLLQKGIAFNVRAVGSFYDAPDQFRSNVDLVVSDPIAITPKNENESTKAWEARIFQQINTALDDISVHCQDAAHFQVVSHHAQQLTEQGGYYSTHFINAQKQATLPPLPDSTIKPQVKSRLQPVNLFKLLSALCFLLMVFPVLLAGWFIGNKADAKNTITFFRIIGATPVLLLWLTFLIVATCFQPFLILPLVVAVIGLKMYPDVKQLYFKPV